MPEIGDNEKIRLYHPGLEPTQKPCAECGKPAVGMFGDTWFCQQCGDKAFKNWHKPLPIAKHPEARSFTEWHELEQQSGKEPNQEPVQLAPIPAYEYPSVPGQRPTPGTPLPVQRVRDPEPQREKVPVSYSPAPARTKPFLPARRYEDPVQQSVPVILNHPAQIEPLPYSSRPSAQSIQPNSIRPVENSPKNSTRAEILDEFLPESNKKGELNPAGRGESKPTTPLQPKFTTKLFDRQAATKKRGRQRAKDRNTSADGVRQLFELWWHKGSGGVAFSTFYRNHLSRDMRAYYPREYIYGNNEKSHTEYRQWRSEWDAKHAVKTA